MESGRDGETETYPLSFSPSLRLSHYPHYSASPANATSAASGIDTQSGRLFSS
jgi:hypothetical protein